MTVYLPAGSLVYLNSTIKLSEHNRQPVALSKNRIEKQTRMGNGQMRKYFIADKESLTISWTKLPSFHGFTIDDGYGAVDLRDFYNGTASKASGALSGRSTFDVSISYGGETKTMEMMFTSFSMELVNRNVKQNSTDTAQEFWNISISLEEV